MQLPFVKKSLRTPCRIQQMSDHLLLGARDQGSKTYRASPFKTTCNTQMWMTYMHNGKSWVENHSLGYWYRVTRGSVVRGSLSGGDDRWADTTVNKTIRLQVTIRKKSISLQEGTQVQRPWDGLLPGFKEGEIDRCGQNRMKKEKYGAGRLGIRDGEGSELDCVKKLGFYSEGKRRASTGFLGNDVPRFNLFSSHHWGCTESRPQQCRSGTGGGWQTHPITKERLSLKEVITNCDPGAKPCSVPVFFK